MLPGRDAPSIKIANKHGLLAVHNRLSPPLGAATDPLVRDDFGFGRSHYFSVQLRPMARLDVRLDGRAVPTDRLAQGSVQILDQRRSWKAVLHPPFETVNFNVAHALLDLLSEEAGGSAVEVVAPAFDSERTDPTLLHLALALMPVFERPFELSALFAESVSLAAASHVLRTYCHGLRARRVGGSGLAPWQQNRARDLLTASIAGDISLTELAASCGLSPSYFARSFKRSFGMPPHRWLMLERVGRAQELLKATRMPLGEIALACGFADQSHFSRVFVSVVAMPPGAWRRLQLN